MGEIWFGYFPGTKFVNLFERSLRGVVGAGFEFLDESLDSPDEADLVVDHGFEAELDIVRQIVETAAPGVRPLLGLGTQQVVVAGQHHLDEVGVGHDPVLVGVEKADALGGLTDADRGAIVFEERA